MQASVDLGGRRIIKKIFFFKQKTAYEIGGSDWSSDVCSSDLKIYGGSFAGFFSSAGVEGSQRTEKCMYIKARWNKMSFAGSTRPRCGRGRKAPCFTV